LLPNVRGVTPLRSQPAVIVIQPADHGTNVESTVDRVELEVSSWNLGSVGHHGTGDDWAKKLGALFESKTLKTASYGIKENVSCSVELGESASPTSRPRGRGNTNSQFRLDWGVVHIAGDILDLGIILPCLRWGRGAGLKRRHG
jgi:hypothetical protein